MGRAGARKTTKADIYARRKDVGAAVAQKLGNKPVQAPDSYINPARFRTYAHKGWLTCPTR